MDSDEGKLFLGGVSWETTEEKLVEHFGNYGAAVSAVVMRDKINNRPRGFAFVSFDNPAVLDRVLADQHVIDGRTVEAKRALSREEQQSSGRSGNSGAGRTSGGGGGGGGGNTRTKKIFVGGLPATLTNEGLSQYFGKYGDVSDVVVMYDANTQRPRGFGFVTFVSDDSVDKVLAVNNFHELEGKLVEVKRALPKDVNQTNGGGGRSTSGTHHAYNASPYEVKVAANSYAQPTGANSYAQPTGGGYPAYGSSGYGAPGGYGYGAANNGLGYGVGGGYGTGPAGGYPGAAPTSGYSSGPAGAQRSPWNNQQSTGFGSGYGGSGMAAQPTGASAGYWNQGYGGYAGAGGSAYGAGGGRGVGPANPAGGAGEQGGASAYVDGGFAGAMDSGYQASWRSNPSAGGGYGAGQVSGPPGGPSGYGGGGYPGQMQ